MDELAERRQRAVHVQLTHGKSWPFTKYREHSVDGGENTGHTPKRQARGDERHDLAVGGVGISANAVDGIGHAVGIVEGIEPDDLTIDRLKKRIAAAKIAEVILGMDPDFEGEGTALVVAQQLKALPVRISRLARGIPAGSAIEYSNAAVLAEAVAGRRPVEGRA